LQEEDVNGYQGNPNWQKCWQGRTTPAVSIVVSNKVRKHHDPNVFNINLMA
jgi:hypothetical protein